MKTFEIGQIFEGTYPPEAAQWCNANCARMDELTPVIQKQECRRHHHAIHSPGNL